MTGSRGVTASYRYSERKSSFMRAMAMRGSTHTPLGAAASAGLTQSAAMSATRIDTPPVEGRDCQCLACKMRDKRGRSALQKTLHV